MKIYIYALCDPRNGEIRYVGKTNNPHRRYISHITNDGGDWNPRKSRWIRNLSSLSLKPEMKILEVCSLENWKERERYWIAEYRKNSTRLTNITSGGDDTSIKYRDGRARAWAKIHHVRLHRCYSCGGLTPAKNEICSRCLYEISDGYSAEWYLFYKRDNARVNSKNTKRDWKREILCQDFETMDKIIKKYKSE